MSGAMIDFAANGGTCKGYLSLPEAETDGPGLILLQEYWGLVKHIEDVADRFAADGYVVLAPDLYGGDSTQSPDEAMRKMMALDIAYAAKQLQGAADFLRSHERVNPKKVGAMGFCMGGQLALFAGTTASVDAVVDFYGIHPEVKPDFAEMACPVMCHFGKSDGFVGEDDARALVATMTAAGVQVDAHFYDAGHAFFNDSRPEAYDADSANQAHARTLQFLSSALD